MSVKDDEEWQTVYRKKSTKNKKKVLPVTRVEGATTCNKDWENSENDCPLILLKIQQAKENLRTSKLWDLFQSTIQECFINCLEQVKEKRSQPTPLFEIVAEVSSVKQVNRSCVCYGIGQFSSCVISRYQLAFLLLILEKLEIPKCHCYIYDPSFTGSEHEVLKTLGLSLILENEEGKRGVDSPTLFYMIHCGKALYNNLLWKNWSVDSLSKVVIIGNSFQGFEQRLPTRIFLREYGYISKVLQGTEEKQFPSTPQHSDIFNDTAVHWFPVQKLEGLDSETWLLRDEPVYESEDVEIIRNQKK
ncbi:SRR1-like protein [Pleurodeles waltl]